MISNLFSKEHDVLIYARTIANEPDNPAKIYREALLSLIDYYEGLVREYQLLIEHSDKSEAKLNLQKTQFRQLAVEFEHKSKLDPMTNVLNREAVVANIRESLQFSQTALILLDIDNFKQVNDTYGHPTGDDVICCLAEEIKNILHGKYNFGRMGGEEFIILLKECTLKQATIVASRLHRHLNKVSFPIPVTVSLGVSWAPQGTCFNNLYNMVDSALYQAKKNGRNRIEVS